MKKLILVLILLVILVSPVLATGNIEKIGGIPLNTNEISVSGNTMYVQLGYAIMAYNISPGIDITNIRTTDVVTEVDTNKMITAMYVDEAENMLYTVGLDNIAVMDISDRLHPVLKTQNGAYNMKAHSVWSEGDYVYVPGAWCLWVFDVSDPTNIVLHKQVSWTGGMAGGTSIIGDENGYIYVGFGYDATSSTPCKIAVINNTDTDNPTIAQNFDYNPTYNGWLSSMAYYNNTLWTVQRGNSIRAYNIANITTNSTPILIEQLWDPNTVFKCWINVTSRGVRLYTASRYGGMDIYNITNPSNSVRLYNDDTKGYESCVASNGNVTVMPRLTGGVSVYNTSTDRSLFVGQIGFPGEIFAMNSGTFQGNDVLAAAGRDTTEFWYNITNPYDFLIPGYTAAASWNVVGRIPRAQAISLSINGNNTMYSGWGWDGNGVSVGMVNLTNMFSDPNFYKQNPPNRVDTWDPGMHVEVLYQDGNFTIGVNSYEYIKTYNFSRYMERIPPIIHSERWWTEIDSARFYPYSNTSQNLYLTKNGDNLVIINFTNSTGWTRDMNFDTGLTTTEHGPPRKFAYNQRDKIVYMLQSFGTSGNQYLRAVDISNISAPFVYPVNTNVKVLTFLQSDIDCNFTDVFMAGSYGENIRMYDFSNPYTPKYVGGSTIKAWTDVNLKYHDGFVYVTGVQTAPQNGELVVFKVTPSSSYVPVPPVVEFNTVPTDSWSGSAPYTVQFVDQTTDSGGSLRNWTWNFDDGVVSYIRNPSHTFSSAGTYTVNLTVLGAETLASKEHNVTVGGVNSDFVANKTYNATAPYTVFFESLETGADTYEWNVTDGGAGVDATTRNFSYTYTVGGSYTVRYKVTNSGTAETATKTRSGYITIGGDTCDSSSTFNCLTSSPYRWNQNQTFPNLRLSTQSTAGVSGDYMQTGISANAYSGMYDELYRIRLYTNTSTLSSVGTINSARYTMYGNSERGTLGILKTTLVYTNPTYPTYYNALDWDATNFTQITDTNLSFPGQYGLMTFNLNSLGLNTISKTSFTNALILSDYDAFNLTPTWSNSGSSWFTIKSPTASSGVYRPKLTVYYTHTCNATVPVPVADISANATYGENPLTVQFYSTGTGNPTDFLWTFSPGNTSTSERPEYTFDVAKDYNVSLTVTNAAGSSTAYKKIEVEEPVIVTLPTAAFTCDPLIGYPPLYVLCEDQSYNSPDNWTWTFGDGNVSTIQHANNTFVEVGLYNISLKVMNAGGEDTLITSDDYINVTYMYPPIANFVSSPRRGIIPLNVSFTDSSENSPTSWYWDFGDGNTSTLQNPNNTFSSIGSYNVSLNATNPAGSDIYEASVDAIEVQSVEPVANFTIKEKIPGDIFTLSFPTTLVLNDTSAESRYRTIIDWGDGSETTDSFDDINLTYKYTKRGVFNLSYTVYNNYGLYDIKYQKIRVMGYQGMERVMEPECMISSSRQLTVTEYEREMCRLCGEC